MNLIDKGLRRFHSLVTGPANVLAAVSGGADSTALLCLLHELRGPLGIARLGVAHVDYGLRGSESDGDEQFVADLANRLGCPFHLKKLSGRSLHEPGMEEWARLERYRFFQDLMQAEGYGYVATGHTANDQAETVLLRILRGAGLRGLRGILPARHDGVIRPLIDLQRSEIEGWLSSKGIGFRTDSSNSDCSFRRNHVRHVLLPELEKREPGAREQLLRIAENSAALVRQMQPGVDNWIGRNAQQFPAHFVIDKAGIGDELHCREALAALCERYGIPVDFDKIDAFPGNANRIGKEFLLPGGVWRYHPARDSIIFASESWLTREFEVPLTIPGVTTCPDALGRVLSFTASHEAASVANLKGDNRCAALDRDACGDLLFFRSARQGDRFTPLGGSGSVDLGRYLSGQGFAKIERKCIGVVESPAAGIVWIPGVQVAEVVRITDRATRVVRIQVTGGKRGLESAKPA